MLPPHLTHPLDRKSRVPERGAFGMLEAEAVAHPDGMGHVDDELLSLAAEHAPELLAPVVGLGAGDERLPVASAVHGGLSPAIMTLDQVETVIIQS